MLTQQIGGRAAEQLASNACVCDGGCVCVCVCVCVGGAFLWGLGDSIGHGE